MPAISAPSKVLVTGASGFIACHIVKNLLADGFQVRGTVRSAARGEYLSKLFDTDKFEVVVADIQSEDQLEAAIAGVDGIAHVASPVHVDDGADPEDVFRPAIDGTLNVYRAAQKVGGVQRIVVTGSLLSVFQPHAPPYTYSAADWNDAIVALVSAKGADIDGLSKYAASKVHAERAANAWVAENKPSFDTAHILPTFVYGPILSDVKSIDEIPLSMKRLLGYFTNGPAGGDTAESVGPVVGVDDVARAHVAVLTRPPLGDGRRHIVASAYDTAFQDYYDAYWSLPEAERPKLPFEAPKGVPGAGLAVRAQRNRFETIEAELGWTFDPVDVIVRDAFSGLSKRVFGL